FSPHTSRSLSSVVYQRLTTASSRLPPPSCPHGKYQPRLRAGDHTETANGRDSRGSGPLAYSKSIATFSPRCSSGGFSGFHSMPFCVIEFVGAVAITFPLSRPFRPSNL